MSIGQHVPLSEAGAAGRSIPSTTLEASGPKGKHCIILWLGTSHSVKVGGEDPYEYALNTKMNVLLSGSLWPMSVFKPEGHTTNIHFNLDGGSCKTTQVSPQDPVASALSASERFAAAASSGPDFEVHTVYTDIHICIYTYMAVSTLGCHSCTCPHNWSPTAWGHVRAPDFWKLPHVYIYMYTL